MSRSAEAFASAVTTRKSDNASSVDPRARISFEDLGLHPPIIASLKAAFPHIRFPTDAQANFIPPILAGKDVILSDITGSGKSFGLILALLNQPRLVTRGDGNGIKRHTTSLVIVPHRDLAYQLLHWIERMVSIGGPPSPLASVAQVLVRDSSEHLKAGLSTLKAESPHILIGTPQALMDIYRVDPAALQLSTLSTVLVDEVDYLIETAPRKDPARSFRKAAEKEMRKLLAHPGVTKQLLDLIYVRRMEMNKQRRDESGLTFNRRRAGLEDGSHPRIHSPQLILSSATLRTHLKNYLFDESGWLEKDNLVKVSKTHSPSVEPPSSSSYDTPGGGVAGRKAVLHSILLISETGVRNVPDAVELPLLPSLDESAAALETSKGSRGCYNADPRLIEKYANTPSPVKPEMLEAVATGFALDVPSIALLVLPASAPLQRVVYELCELGVNACALDLQSKEKGRSYLLNGGSDVEDNPTLLVSTLASTRGVDLPELSHVFILEAEGKKVNGRTVDDYLHISGRVGRFGRGGKVITVVEDEEADGESEKKGAVMSNGSKMKRILRTIGVRAVRFEHFD